MYNMFSKSRDARTGKTILSLPRRKRRAVWNRNAWGSRFRSVLGQVSRAMTVRSALIVLVCTAIAIVAVTEMKRDELIVEPFSVPRSFEERGLTSLTITMQVVERMRNMEVTASKDSGGGPSRSTLHLGRDILTDFYLPGTNVTVRSGVVMLRKLFGINQRHLSGAVISIGRNELEFRLALWREGDKDTQSTSIRISTTKPDDAIDGRLAEAAERRVNPYALAAYLGLHESDAQRALAISREVLDELRLGSDRASVARWYNLQGRVFCSAGKYSQALRSFQDADEYSPSEAILQNNIGFALLQQAQYAEAADHLRRAIAASPKYAAPYSNLGGALYELNRGSFKEAIADFKKGISLDKTFAPAYINWGVVLLDQGDALEARAMFLQASALTFEDARIYYLLGKADYALNRLDEAITYYHKASELRLQDSDLYQDWDNALKATLGTRIGISDPQILLRWADSLVFEGKYAAAIVEYQFVLTFDKHNKEALNNLGEAQLLSGKVGDSVASFEQAISFDSGYVNARYNMGIALESQGRPEQAVAQLRRAIALEPSFTDGQVRLGRALSEAGNCEDALLSFRDALQLDPSNPYAHNYLGVVLHQEGRRDEAIALIRKATDLDPDEPEFHYVLGMALQEANLPGAAAEFEKASSLSPIVAAELLRQFRTPCRKSAISDGDHHSLNASLTGVGQILN